MASIIVLYDDGWTNVNSVNEFPNSFEAEVHYELFKKENISGDEQTKCQNVFWSHLQRAELTLRTENQTAVWSKTSLVNDNGLSL